VVVEGEVRWLMVKRDERMSAQMAWNKDGRRCGKNGDGIWIVEADACYENLVIHV